MGEKYNGWHNYETWNWNLWYGDDDQYLEDMVNNCDDVYELAKALEAYASEDTPELPTYGFFADMLNTALREVNWDELAAHYWADYREEEDADNE